MKAKNLVWLALLLLCGCTSRSEKISGRKIIAGNNLVGIISDSSTGKGIAGIPVSDGYNFTLTDRKGVYQMKADPKSRVVYYSLPAEYKAAQDSIGGPAFYAFRDSTLSVDRHDFQLEKLSTPEEEFCFLALSDPQCRWESNVERYLTESLPDMQATVDELLSQGKSVYGMGLGDIIHDNPNIWAPMAANFRSIHTQHGTVPIYNVPGNHDHSNRTTNDYDALQNYINHFGPTDYSLNRGQAHIVCMDDVVYLSSKEEMSETEYKSCNYAIGFSDEQLEWLKQDLDLVENKEDKLILFFVHAPFLSGAEKGSSYVNYDKHYHDVLSLLTGFAHAEIFLGHMHYAQYMEHNDYLCASGSPIREQICGSICGTWWSSTLNLDGTPNGYAVYTVSGNKIDDMYCKGVGLDSSVQMRVYDGSQIYPAGKGTQIGWEEELKGHFVVNLWYGNTENWQLELLVDGKSYPMEHCGPQQADQCARAFFLDETKSSYNYRLPHFWHVAAPSGEPSKEKDWTIKATHILPDGGMKNVYSCSTLQQDFTGFYKPASAE